VTTDYTDIIARFTDQLAAETLAKFIASAGFSCDVVDIWGPFSLQPYGVRVSRSQVADIRRVLELTPVVSRLTPVAAQLKAAQLAREEVPCYVGGEHSFWPASYSLDSITTLKVTKEAGDMIAVPACLFKKAMRVLNQAPISEAGDPRGAFIDRWKKRKRSNGKESRREYKRSDFPRGFVRGKYASRLRTLSFFITTACVLGFRSDWRVTSHIVLRHLSS